MGPKPLRKPSASICVICGPFLVVRIRLDEEEVPKKLPLGAAGTTAIYTNSGKPFHLISKIALRIKGWMYYLPL